MTLHVYSNIGKKAVSLSRNPPTDTATAPAPVAGVNQMHAQRAPCGMPRYAHITHVRKYFIVVHCHEPKIQAPTISWGDLIDHSLIKKY